MSDEDEGFIKFEVSDWDLEYGSGVHKPRRRTKNQAIYGIWADSESDDDNDKSEGKKKKKGKNYTTGINFAKSDKKLQDEIKSSKDNDPTTTKDSSISKHKQKSKNKHHAPSFATRFAGTSNDAEFGQWEIYTKGVGSKLLQKMGYQPGKGLGKNLQGIIEPIQPKKRPGTGAIGLYGPESTNRKLRTGDDDNDESHEELKDKDETNKKNWRRDDENKQKQKTVKVLTKSTEEIIKESVQKSWNSVNTDLSGMKIIDMTGPEQRVLTGLTQLHQSKPEKPKEIYETTEFNTRFDIPELKQNIERLVLLSEKNLVKRKREYDRNLNHIENLNEEKDRIQQLLKIQREQIENLDSFNEFIESLEETRRSDEKLSFEKCLDKFDKFFTDDLKRKLRSFKLDNLIQQTFNQILREELRTWHPFDNFAYDYSHLFERLKNLTVKTKTYEILLWDHWNPVVCRALQTWPTMKNYEPIIAFIEKWRPKLPKWLYEYFIANNLIPKLKSEVDEWNPLTDTVSIHSWIHPWLPVLLVSDDNDEIKFLFEPIYEVIRMKLSNALTNWHPSDCSARLILEPWKNVFNEASMQTFLDVNILPKLEQSMQSFSINPNQQSMNEWNWVISWRTLITLNTIVSILERYFFPKWLNVLYVWLNSGVANFNEISSWYQGWKTLMGEDLISHATVKDFLKKALIMMDHALNLNTGLKSFQSYYQAGVSQNQNIMEPPTTTTTLPPPPDTETEQMNFRQLVEMKAAENGIIFMPIANRFEDGRQVFKFGPYLIYIDNQVVFHQKFVHGKRTWLPIRVQDLIELC